MTKTLKESESVVKKIIDLGNDVYLKIMKHINPRMVMPLRSLQNVKYDEKQGYFEVVGKLKGRTLTASTVKTFAQTLLMMNESKKLIETDDIATKREMYYISKNWGDALFHEQPESDTVMDDFEAMMGVNREQIGFVPEEKGGAVAGKLIVIDKDPDTGKELRIDCTKFGSGAYSVPTSVEHLQFDTDAKFILAIETAGMFQRMVKHNYWKKANCILVSMGGVPTRACRRFIRRLADEKKIPTYVFSVDGNETILVQEDGLIKNVTLKELMKNRPVHIISHPFENERAKIEANAITFDDVATKMEPINQIIRHKITEDLFEVVTERGFSVKATRSHSVTVYDSALNEFIEKTPQEINRETDYAIVSIDVPVNESLHKVDLAVWVDRNKAIVTEEQIINKMTKMGFPRFIEGNALSQFSRLLGYYVAEGHLDNGGPAFSFHANETELIEDVEQIAREVFNLNITKNNPHTTETQIRINNVLLKNVFEDLAGKGAGAKQVPFIIFNTPRQAKIEFLKGYFRGDGRVDYKPEKSSVELWAKTVSRKLVYDIVLLISQLGGVATIQHPKETSSEHEIEIETASGTIMQKIQSKQKLYLVSIANKETLTLLIEIVDDLNSEAITHLTQNATKTSKMDSLPRAFVRHYRPLLRAQYRGLLETHLPPSSFQWPHIAKERLRQLFKRQEPGKGLELLKNLVESKTTLVRIKEIKKVEPTEEYVYDIEMKDSHRFFANGICVHNTDGDPYGYLNIYRTLKVGSGNAAHINKFFCVPNAKFLGVTPQDIIDYKLPTHPLKDIDVKRVKDGMKNDPFVQHYKEWQKALNQLVAMKKRAEQQAFAKHHLNFVMDTYLPEKLKNPKTWLP